MILQSLPHCYAAAGARPVVRTPTLNTNKSDCRVCGHLQRDRYHFHDLARGDQSATESRRGWLASASRSIKATVAPSQSVELARHVHRPHEMWAEEDTIRWWLELLGCTFRLAVHELFRCPGRLI
jgi:hypothetical protein